MVMKYYGTPTANNQRPIIPLFEAGVDVEKEVEFVKVNLMKGEHKQPGFLLKNPFGKTPCFQDGDLILFESRAIARYLAEKYQHQGVPLLGKTPHERAIIDQWCEVESQNFNREVGTMFGEIFLATRVQNRPVNEALVAACLAKTGEIFDVYEKQLSKSTFIAGDSYSLADLFHIPMLNRLMDTKRDIFTGRPHVLAWAENLIARPAYQKTVEAVMLLSSE